MASGERIDVFGRVRLGYVVIGSRRLAEWRRFLTEGIGLHLASDSAGELAFRMDGHARRLVVQQDDAEDITAVGWHVDDESVLEALLGRLAAKGVGAERVEGDAAASRGVAALHRFTGPKGLTLELFTRPAVDTAPLDMLCSGFVTGDGGLGHLSLMSREPVRGAAFWRELFDARVSDVIEISAGGRAVLDVTFLRLNRRHHSVAIAATRKVAVDMYRTRIQHLNLEAASLDDLSGAYERCRDLGYEFTRGIGQHPNDRELSFYIMTPSGFELELGWDALTVEESAWEAGRTYHAMSTWGHDIPGRFSSELKLSHLVHAARSLGRTEYLPW